MVWVINMNQWLGFFVAILTFASIGLVIVSLLRTRSEAPDGAHSAGHSSLFSFAVAVIVITLLWLIGWLTIPLIYGNPRTPGEAGDMFGVLTSWFSGLAFAGLISTLLMQRQELEYQRQELRSTREEFSRQRFESTLFSILDLWAQHIQSLRIEDDEDGRVLTGRAVLDYYASELPFQSSYYSDLADGAVELSRVLKDNIKDIQDQVVEYENLYLRELETDLGPYFRLLFHAIRHIVHSDLSDDEKLRYSKVVRAHLSSSELDLLFFNCQSRWGEGFKPWIEKYQLLKHIRPETREQNQLLDRAIDSGAFSG